LDEDIRSRLVMALGLSESDIDGRCPIQIVSTGHSKVMIGILARLRLNALTPVMDELKEISRLIDCNGYYVFTFDSDDDAILTYGRMFAPAIGIPEDPVTGNANGPLGAYLVKHGLIDVGGAMAEFKGYQGEAIGRTGVVGVSVDIENGEPVRVRIGGSAVIVFKTEMRI
jgi:PhzF family phenazine biosynthesis protein